MTALQILLVVMGGLMFAGIIVFLLVLLKYYLTPICGDFIIYVKPDEDNESIYEMKLDSHPLTWTNRKHVRFNVIVKK